MDKSKAYAITKLLQSFFETALDIKTKYIDTGSYTITDNPLDFGTDEKPSLRALERRLSDMCCENDATYYMGAPYLSEDVMDAYASHIIDNSDIIASGKITTEKIDTLNAVIHFFEANMKRDEQGFGGPDNSISAVYNTIMYIKEWETDYCNILGEEYDMEAASPRLSPEIDRLKQLRSVALSPAEIEPIFGKLHQYSEENNAISNLAIEHHLIFESASAAGVDFNEIDLYDDKQTAEFYNSVYDYSKRVEGRRSFSLFFTPYEGLPVREDKRKVYDDDEEPRKVLIFYYEAFVCKWALLHVDLLRLYDYALATGDPDILKDMKEFLDDAIPNRLAFKYRREKLQFGGLDESIFGTLFSFSSKLSDIENTIERFLFRTEKGIVGDNKVRDSKLIGAVFGTDMESLSEGNKANWTEKTVTRFLNLTVDDFVYVLRGNYESFKRYGLRKFDSPSLNDIFDYVERHSGGFNKDKMVLLLSQLEASNSRQYQALVDLAVKESILMDYVDDETGQRTIEYYDDTPLDESGQPIPEKCYEQRIEEYYPADKFRYDYAVGILYEKLGYPKDESQEPMDVDHIKIYKYKTALDNAKKTKVKPQTTMQPSPHNPVKDFVDSVMGVSPASLSEKLSDPYSLGKKHALNEEMLNAMNEAEGRIVVAYAHFLDNFDYPEGEEQYHPHGLTWSAILSCIRGIKEDLGKQLVAIATNGKPAGDPAVQDAVAHYHELLNESNDTDLSPIQLYNFLKGQSDGFNSALYPLLISEIDNKASKAYENMKSIAERVFEVNMWNKPQYYVSVVNHWDEEGNPEREGLEAHEDVDTMVKVVFGTEWMVRLAIIMSTAKDCCPQGVTLPNCSFIQSHTSAVKKSKNGKMNLDENKLLSLKGKVVEIAELPKGETPSEVIPESSPVPAIDSTPEFAEFSKYFNSDNINKQERIKLYDALRRTAMSGSVKKPHLPICAALIKMRERRLKWIKPQEYSWPECRDSILQSLGVNPVIAKSVRESPKENISKKHWDKADEIIKSIK